MGRLRQTALGIGAAMRTPLWLRDERIRLLIDGTEQRTTRPPAPAEALRAAQATLRLLGRIPLLPWRNTCLYRSVAECLVLRRLGISCRLRIGVRRNASASEAMEAHAWVDRAGQTPSHPSHVILRQSG